MPEDSNKGPGAGSVPAWRVTRPRSEARDPGRWAALLDEVITLAG